LAAAVAVGAISGFGTLGAAEFAKGADVGWLSQMEKQGVVFRDAAGHPADCLAVLKSCGCNAVRLRVWVNPKEGWCGRDDVVRMATRAHRDGFRLMIDFHYSDGWADPGKQTKPAAWASHGIDALEADVARHTTEVLRALQAAGVEPEWVQVGNETNDGMLWEDGRASKSMANFAALVNSGCDAVKAVFPRAKVIVHLANGFDAGLYRWMLDGLTKQGVRFDVIGMSLYPPVGEWSKYDQQCLANMTDVVARYGKDVMVCEVGMAVDAPGAAHAFLSDILAKTRSVRGGKGLGIFYWEPECHDNWQGYRMGAFAPDGRPTAAMDAFR
jgi:arabinogalactan endo-1,4-beta-galactosidase